MNAKKIFVCFAIVGGIFSTSYAANGAWLLQANSVINTAVGTKVGIGLGTTVPATLLNLYTSSATSEIFRVSAGANQQIQMGTTNWDGYMSLKNGSGVATGYLSSNGTSYFNGGKVGIGTSSPATLLHVNGAGPRIRATNTSGTVKTVEMGADNTGGYIETMESGSDLRFYSGNASLAMTIISGGNVGVGTLTPSARLTLYGNDNVNTKMFEIYTKQINTGSFQKIAFIGATGSSVNDGYFQLSDNGVVKVNIAANNVRGGNTFFNGGGNVGIGTENPNYKLAVNGTIGAKEVIVTANGWADYVFKKDYDLKPLKDVEKFIKTHNHLEGIPTETEVAANGVAMGDMQAKLLQKIEELTLYTVDLSKKVDHLTMVNNELKKKINGK